MASQSKLHCRDFFFVVFFTEIDLSAEQRDESRDFFFFLGEEIRVGLCIQSFLGIGENGSAVFKINEPCFGPIDLRLDGLLVILVKKVL